MLTRQAIMLSNQPESSHTLAITIDSKRMIGALIDVNGNLSSVNALPNPISESGDIILYTITTLIKQVLLEAPDKVIDGIGITITAPVHRNDRIILRSDTMPQLEDMNLIYRLQQDFNYPIVIENDVNAMALLEAHQGIGQGTESIFYVFVDEEIKGAIIQNGKIWRGMHSNAGEIGSLVAGWMGTKAITLGQRASGQGIAAEYNMRSRKHRTPTIDEIIQYARQGDHLAVRVIRDGARILGSVLSPVMNLIDPEMVVVGGRFAHTGDLWWTNFSEAFIDSSMPHLAQIIISRSNYDEDATLQGAALIARMATASVK